MGHGSLQKVFACGAVPWAGCSVKWAALRCAFPGVLHLLACLVFGAPLLKLASSYDRSLDIFIWEHCILPLCAFCF